MKPHLLILAVVPFLSWQSVSAASAEALGWTFRDASNPHIKAIEAILSARDGRARLVIRCDITGDRTLSIQYKPHQSTGLSMAPVALDWAPSRGVPLSSKLVWEPALGGAFARDGEDNRDASEVAEAIEAQSGTLRIAAADGWGDPVETTYDNSANRHVIGRVLAECPWDPEPQDK